MPRPRKIKIVKKNRRVRDSGGRLEIVETDYCGECDQRLTSATIQKPHRKVAMVCDNIDGHKFGQIYLFPLKKVIIVTS